MTGRKNPQMVGAFILGAVALLVAAVVLFGAGTLFKQTRRVVAFFEGSVQGLSVGAPVNFRGVRVGSVVEVVLQLEAATGNVRIPVYIELEPDRVAVVGSPTVDPGRPQLLIERGLRARLVAQSFVTGQLMVELDFLPDVPTRLVGTEKDIPEIPTAKSELEEITERLSDLPLQEIARTTLSTLHSVERLLNAPELTASLKALAGTLQGTDRMVTEISPVLTETLENINITAVGLQAAVVEATETLRTVRESGGTTLAGIDSFLTNTENRIGPILSDLRTILGALKTTVDGVSDIVGQRGGARRDLDIVLRNLAAASASLRAFADQVERNPNSLLVGKRQ